ncbi:hypothetical protein [Marinigracilibium pacificum]|uniref:Uncharacterized protein n=1 Tax=Marinigracilibium pacificum TaxID=2729599 RepID=A0A848IYK0_9BACT|nr:hypothetical protein [Marinigracilibium pacificum]NMM48355.1 hypothetical protein [Marinigracilibium pacificum]
MNKHLYISLKALSYLGLMLTLIPAFCVFYDIMDMQQYKNLILAGTLIWLFTAPFWINRKLK